MSDYQHMFLLITAILLTADGVLNVSYNCDDYQISCDEYCGGSALVESFKCSTSESGVSGTHSCVCKSLPDLFQTLQICGNYRSQCATLCNSSVNQGEVTPQITCEPDGSGTLGFSCECQVLPLPPVELDTPKCYNHLPESEGTCDDRKFWGSCSEGWMQNKYFCAETCGFCEWGVEAQYDCYQEFQTCAQRCQGSEDNIQEFACYISQQKNDCICKPGIQRINLLQLAAALDPDDDCFDFLPEEEGTCEQRVEWGSCDEYWMQNKNYCARSCGYCTPKTAVPSPSPNVFENSSAPQIIPSTSSILPAIFEILSPSPEPSPSVPDIPPSPLLPQITVPSILVPEEVTTIIDEQQQVISNGVSISYQSPSQPEQQQVVSNGVSIAQQSPSQSAQAAAQPQDTDDNILEYPARSFLLDYEDYTDEIHQSSSSPSTTIESGLSEIWVAAHNAFRSAHCAPPLTWSVQLEEAALQASQQCQYVESKDFGQNFYRATGYGSLEDISDPIGYIVDYWYNQGVQNGFNLTNPWFIPDAGTTTQVIWGSSTELGCGWEECDDGWLYVNCMYLQPGNVVSDFAENVNALC